MLGDPAGCPPPFRKHGLAMGLLNLLRQNDDAIHGLMSSHPATCLAAAKAFGSQSNATFEIRETDLLRWHQPNRAGLYPRKCIGHQERISSLLCQECSTSCLFDREEQSGRISSVFTSFFVDHAEPLEALSWVREGMDWPFGELSGSFLSAMSSSF